MAHYVKWYCPNCGYKWDGLSPNDRVRRPFCGKCGNGRVRVIKGYIDKDKEKWKEVRKEVLERDKYICQRCGKKIHRGNARVHHITYDDYFDPDTMITLCQDCHLKKHETPLWLKILITIVIVIIIMTILHEL